MSRNLGTIKQAAALGAVSERTIRRYIAAGELTGYRFGSKLLRLDLDEVETMLRPIPTVRSGDAA